MKCDHARYVFSRPRPLRSLRTGRVAVAYPSLVCPARPSSRHRRSGLTESVFPKLWSSTPADRRPYSLPPPFVLPCCLLVDFDDDTRRPPHPTAVSSPRVEQLPRRAEGPAHGPLRQGGRPPPGGRRRRGRASGSVRRGGPRLDEEQEVSRLEVLVGARAVQRAGSLWALCGGHFRRGGSVCQQQQVRKKIVMRN